MKFNSIFIGNFYLVLFLIVSAFFAFILRKIQLKWLNSLTSSLLRQISYENPNEKIIRVVKCNSLLIIFFTGFIVVFSVFFLLFLIQQIPNFLSGKTLYGSPHQDAIMFIFLSFCTIYLPLLFLSSLLTVHVITSERIITKSLNIPVFLLNSLFQNKIIYLSDIKSVSLYRYTITVYNKNNSYVNIFGDDINNVFLLLKKNEPIK